MILWKLLKEISYSNAFCFGGTVNMKVKHKPDRQQEYFIKLSRKQKCERRRIGKVPKQERRWQ